MPHREAVESPVRDTNLRDAHQESTPNTGTSSFSLLGTPAHRVTVETPGRSHRVPGASQTPIGSIGVTPARIMGAAPDMILYV